MVSDEAADFLVATFPAAAGEATVDALMHEWSSSIEGFYWQYSTAVPRP